jgi:CheY-like chemotaxis protein
MTPQDVDSSLTSGETTAATSSNVSRRVSSDSIFKLGQLLHSDQGCVKNLLEGYGDESKESKEMDTRNTSHSERSSGEFSRFASVVAKADSSGFFTECSEQFLLITGLETDFRKCNIISLAKFSTIEELQQHAYMLDELGSSGTLDAPSSDVSSSQKWVAELENTYLNMSYEMHVTLSMGSRMNPSNVLDVELVELCSSSRSSLTGPVSRHHSSTKEVGNLRVLVVDDSVPVLKLVSRLIRDEGHTVDCKVDGLEALEALKNNEYDAVFMDIHMPEMGGLEASYEFRNHEGLMHQYRDEAHSSKLKIIAMSSDFSDDLKREVIIAGFDGFLKKPLTVQAFRALKLKPSTSR